MADKSETARGGIGLLGAVFLLFLYLKLTDHIDWSWWWVTAPLWGGVALFFGVLILFAAGALVWFVIADWAKKRARKRRALR
ncbi:hypothetical protein LCGC14_1765850 [marine sediment metagenome]|uniref:Uncharacterized protein n=1 Tax=marine sediment metagenome TaxID=412755 RepID=A0A0F9GZQ2_9ZZZZ